ncbi:major facilitator superfamily domain-containing protein [Spinellus fusiger]|nr:major facilitator superfamily domain-containing protein [Spinellus fusiger]
MHEPSIRESLPSASLNGMTSIPHSPSTQSLSIARSNNDLLSNEHTTVNTNSKGALPKSSSLARLSAVAQKRISIRPPVNNDPRLYSKGKKRWILACLALGSSLNGLCSTIYFPALPYIAKDLNTDAVGMSLTTSLFILFGGIGPILWASMSDFYHIRRSLYLSSLIIFIVASVGCGLVNNAWVLVVMRCIQSIGTSVTNSVGAGTVSDCWKVTERGSAFSILFVGQFFGPLIGPIIGGGITTLFGWRSTFWFCVGYGTFLFCFLFVFLPETYRVEHVWDTPFPTSNNLAHLSKESGGNQKENKDINIEAGYTSVEDDTSDHDANIMEKPPTRILNPFKSITMLKHLFVLLIAIQTGLSFIGAGVGNLIGSYVSGRLSDYLLKRSRQQRGGECKVEDRITLNAWPGGYILVPLGVLLFGWSVYAKLTVWSSIVGFSIVCFGMSQVYSAGSAYLVDAIPGKGASVTAASNLLRMVMACILSLIAHPVVGSIGPGYLATILASLNIIGMSCFVIVKLKGSTLRKRADIKTRP